MHAGRSSLDGLTLIQRLGVVLFVSLILVFIFGFMELVDDLWGDDGLHAVVVLIALYVLYAALRKPALARRETPELDKKNVVFETLDEAKDVSLRWRLTDIGLGIFFFGIVVYKYYRGDYLFSLMLIFSGMAVIIYKSRKYRDMKRFMGEIAFTKEGLHVGPGRADGVYIPYDSIRSVRVEDKVVLIKSYLGTLFLQPKDYDGFLEKICEYSPKRPEVVESALAGLETTNLHKKSVYVIAILSGLFMFNWFIVPQQPYTFSPWNVVVVGFATIACFTLLILLKYSSKKTRKL